MSSGGMTLVYRMKGIPDRPLTPSSGQIEKRQLFNVDLKDGGETYNQNLQAHPIPACKQILHKSET